MGTTFTKSLLFCLLGALVLLGATHTALGGGTQSGLAVAVSPDGTRLVAGGSNRALYELDPATLEVKRRAWYGRRVMKMAFSQDGTVLVVESTKAIEWLKADTFAPFVTLTKAYHMAPMPKLGLVAVSGREHPTGIRLYGFTDGEVKAVIEHDIKKSVAAFGLSPDGKTLALLHSREKDEAEPKVARKEIPEEITKQGGTVLATFKQQHDGYTSRFLLYDVETGKARLDTRTWFGTGGGGHVLAWHGGLVHVVTYDNVNATFDAEGKATLFQLSNSYNYARDASNDGAAFLTGGLRDGSRTLVEGMKATTFRVDRIDGWPEYYKTFSVADDGTAFGGTTAFRLVKLDADGKIVKIIPVY